MNLREGTRRLALLLGVAGAIGGSFVSFFEFQEIESQRARHNRFGQLASSDVVFQERRCRLAGIMSGCSDLPRGWSVTPSEAAPQIDPKTGERIDLSGGLVSKQPGDVHYDALAKKYGGTPARGPWEKYAEKDRGGVVLDMSRSIPIPSELELNKSGVKRINWGHDFSVESIETEDSQTLYPTPAPTWPPYALLVIFPILGFIAPWAVTRSIGWIFSGFRYTVLLKPLLKAMPFRAHPNERSRAHVRCVNTRRARHSNGIPVTIIPKCHRTAQFQLFIQVTR